LHRSCQTPQESEVFCFFFSKKKRFLQAFELVTTRTRIILAGAGHAHIAALRRLAKNPPDAEIILINDGVKAWYTGALPALIRGDIAEDRAWLDVASLAKSCDATFIDTKFIDFEGDWINLDGRPPLRFDILAISIGATPNGGVKPVPSFMARVKSWDRIETPIIGIIGAGAAGVELALALRQRLGAKARIAIRAPEAKILPGAPPRVQRVIREELDHARIQVAAAFTHRMDDLVHAYTPEPLYPVRPTLQLEGHDRVFATGDCAAFAPPLPRSGAIAVRQGHTLAANLRRLANGTTLQKFHPPPTTLAILSLNADEAAAWYGPLSWTGPLAMTLKNRLDSNWLK
jgi:selenide,water dikinase